MNVPADSAPRAPYEPQAWALALRTAHQLLRAAGAGHGPALTLLAVVLAVSAVWHPWTLLAALVTGAAGVHLLRAQHWGAHALYPSVLALVQGLGPDRASEVLARHTGTRNQPAALNGGALSVADALAASVAAQVRADRLVDCRTSHAPLCRHRPAQRVPAPPALARALYPDGEISA